MSLSMLARFLPLSASHLFTTLAFTCTNSMPALSGPAVAAEFLQIVADRPDARRHR